MKFPLLAVLFFLGFGFSQICSGQTSGNANVAGAGGGEVALAVPASSYVVFGATTQQEALVRSQIQIMQPGELPLRVVFVPHWKYIENTRIFQLQVPTRALRIVLRDLLKSLQRARIPEIVEQG
jgi:hypothetical protein